MVKFSRSSDHILVKSSIKAAGSIVLSTLASFLAILAFLLAYVFHSDWAAVLWWAVLPELLVFTVVYLVADFANGTTRKQAIIAGLVALPALVSSVWFFQALRL